MPPLSLKVNVTSNTSDSWFDVASLAQKRSSLIIKLISLYWMSLWMSLNFLVCHVSLVWMGRTCPSSSFCNSSVAVGRVCVCVWRLHFSGVHWIMKHGALSNGTLSDHWPGPVSWLDATLCRSHRFARALCPCRRRKGTACHFSASRIKNKLLFVTVGKFA